MRLRQLIEKYTTSNSALLRHYQTREIDPYRFWHAFPEWAESEGREDLLADYDEDEPDHFYQLPKDVQDAFSEFIRQHKIDWMMQHDPAEAPTWAHSHTRREQLISPQTWLVHFSDDAYDVAREGFKYGIDDHTRLGLTTYMSQHEKEGGGFNFAFIANSRFAMWSAQKRKYGKHAVMFQHGGVHTHHYADQEDQIVFYGPDVDHRGIVWIRNDSGDWTVMPHPSKEGWYPALDERGVYTNSDFAKVTAWIENNYRTYAKVITGW